MGRLIQGLVTCILIFSFSGIQASAKALKSWSNETVRHRITSFVEAVSDKHGPHYISPEQRVAVFDNDGTLWSEYPLTFQAMFSVDRLKMMAKDNPKIVNTRYLKALVEGDYAGFLKGGKRAVGDLAVKTQTGMSVREFQALGKDWVFNAIHPTKNRPYAELHYQPMIELLQYLRKHDFEIYIVSGGGATFIRTFAPEIYKIPPQNVIGSQIGMKYMYNDGQPQVLREPSLLINDDKAEKVVSIERFIGKRPIFAAGNSDGDFEMLEWTTTQDGPALGLLVHHTDVDREFAYDRGAPIAALERGLDEYKKRGWILVDMKNDWKVVYPPKNKLP